MDIVKKKLILVTIGTYMVWNMVEFHTAVVRKFIRNMHLKQEENVKTCDR